MECAPLRADLTVRLAEHRIVRAYVDRDRARRERIVGVWAEAIDREIKLFHLPRAQTLGDLLGESLGIGRRVDRFRRKNARRPMMPMAVGGGSGEARDHHVGAILADDADV